MSGTLRVVGAVFRAGDKILACRRNPDKAAGGKWEFPGGKVEAGESAEEALRRELAEELSVGISGVGPLISRETTDSIDLACYWVSSDALPHASTDHDEFRWCSAGELHQLDWAAADLPTVHKLQRAGTPFDSEDQEEA